MGGGIAGVELMTASACHSLSMQSYFTRGENEDMGLSSLSRTMYSTHIVLLTNAERRAVCISAAVFKELLSNCSGI